MPFGENIRKLREEKGMSQAELADKVGVTQSMIARYETYVKVPNIQTSVKLAKALGTTCEKLVEWGLAKNRKSRGEENMYKPTPFEKNLAAMLMTFSIIESLAAMIIAIIALLLWLKL